MKVKQVIKLLEATYEPDDELMIDWVDRFVFDDVDEVSKEVIDELKNRGVDISYLEEENGL